MTVSDDDDTRTPLDQALDVFVYLPVGFVFELPRSIPRFIDRGRRQVDQACAIGLEALHLGNRGSSDRVTRVREQTAATLRGLGVAPPQGDDLRGEPVDRPAAPTLSVVADPDPAPAPARATGNGSAAPVAPAPGPLGPAPDAGTLAIPGYDSLSASQVVPRLEGLTSDELETVRSYEQATRGRKTILSKIAQLQAS
jgi:hypothetical protein